VDQESLAVLVVEDDGDIAQVVAMALESEGHRVHAAPDGREALRALEQGWPDVLVLDRMLPDMDGVALCERVRALEPAEGYLPILMLTALDRPAQKAAGFACGADDYITKPFNLDELAARVRVWGRAGRRIRESAELRRKYEHSQRLALTDPLTGLYNRWALENLLEQEIEKARRLEYSLGLLIVDIDQFKTINDTQGHLQGDKVLSAVARALRQALRKSDMLARYGGDEFVALLPGCEPQALRGVGEQLRKAVAELPVDALGGTPVTVSIGGVAARGHAVEMTPIFRTADDALYRAKAAGRNCVALADDRPDGGRETARVSAGRCVNGRPAPPAAKELR
jgi:two-component system cell cycle response regulator